MMMMTMTLSNGFELEIVLFLLLLLSLGDTVRSNCVKIIVEEKNIEDVS